MLVPNQYVLVHWCPANKNHYESKGYTFTKSRDALMVKAEDLMENSTIKVKVICDYCGEEYETQYKLYFKGLEEIPKNACRKCWRKKAEEVNLKRYGSISPLSSEVVQEKVHQTVLAKYGVDNVFQNDTIKQKIKETNFERYGAPVAILNKEIKKKANETVRQKYGVDNASQNEDIKKKIVKTFLNRYGVQNISQSDYCIEKVRQTSMKKRGVPCPFQDPTVQAKIRESLTRNGTVPTSKAEREMCNRLIELFGEDNCHPSYPFQSITFDCYVEYKGVKIDIEYDGWFWHKSHQEQDKRRNYFVTRRGIKVLRFQANKEIPTKELLSQAIEELVKNSKMVKIIKLDI